MSRKANPYTPIKKRMVALIAKAATLNAEIVALSSLILEESEKLAPTKPQVVKATPKKASPTAAKKPTVKMPAAKKPAVKKAPAGKK
ncbi:MAG: hypothetical protein Q8M76_01765 [Spirochaetaceae bacterium]|nr:hypothetical protein [Spirochaetaceae bacterium]